MIHFDFCNTHSTGGWQDCHFLSWSWADPHSSIDYISTYLV